MYPQRNRFEMEAHQTEVKYNTPGEQLKRATRKLAAQNKRNAVVLRSLLSPLA